jgi:hypothetical protein
MMTQMQSKQMEPTQRSYAGFHEHLARLEAAGLPLPDSCTAAKERSSHQHSDQSPLKTAEAGPVAKNASKPRCATR